MEPNSKLNDVNNIINFRNNEINQIKQHLQEQKNGIIEKNYKFNQSISMLSHNNKKLETNKEKNKIINPFADENGNLANLNYYYFLQHIQSHLLNFLI